MPHRSSCILAFDDYVGQRWQEGEQRSACLYAELKQQGFLGSLPSVFPLVCNIIKMTGGWFEISAIKQNDDRVVVIVRAT